MKSMIRSTVRRLLHTPHSAWTAVFMIFLVSLGRLFEEMAIGAGNIFLNQHGNLVVVRLCFYTYLYFCVRAVLRIAFTRVYPGEGNIAAVALLVGFMPPIADALIGTPPPITYEYMLNWEWLFYDPSYQPIGETITVWTGIASIGLFVSLASGSAFRGFIASAVLYCFLALSGIVLSSWLDDLLPREDTHLWMINGPHLAVSYLLWHVFSWKSLWPRMKRLNHAFPFAAIVLLGAAWTSRPLGETLAAVAMVVSAFYVLLVHNDAWDAAEDALAERRAPPSDSNDVILSSLLIALLAVAVYAPLQPVTATGVLLILAAGFIYHHPSVRLKEVFCMAYKVEGLWAAVALGCGMAWAEGFLPGLPYFWPAVLLFGGGALFSMPKDWKDSESDRKAGVPTLYVRLTDDQRTEETVHRRLCTSVLLAMSLMTVLLFAIYGWTWLHLATGVAALVATGWLLHAPSRFAAVEGFYLLLGVWLILLAMSLQSVEPNASLVEQALESLPDDPFTRPHPGPP